MVDRHQLNARRPRQFFRNDRLIDDIDAEDCRRRYRFTPDNIDRLLGLIGHRLQRHTRQNHALTPRQCLCLALRFMPLAHFSRLLETLSALTLPRCQSCYDGDRLPLWPKRPCYTFPDDRQTQTVDEGRFSCHCSFSICNIHRRRHTYSYHCTAQLWGKLTTFIVLFGNGM